MLYVSRARDWLAPPPPDSLARVWLTLAVLLGAAAGVTAALGPAWAWMSLLAFACLPALIPRARTGLALGSAWDARFSVGVALVIYSIHMAAIGRGPIKPITVALLLLFGLWLLDRLCKPHAPVRSPGFSLIAIAYMAAMLASTLGEFPGEMYGQGLIPSLPKLVIALLIVQVIDTSRKAERARFHFLAAAGLSGLIGIGQWGLATFGGIELSYVDLDYRYSHAPIFGSTLRASGFARFANQYAGPLAVVFTMAAYLAAAAPSRSERRFAVGVLISTGLAVILALVRASQAAAVLGVALLPWIHRTRRRARWIALEGALALALVLFASSEAARGYVLGGEGFSSRTELVADGLAVTAEHPWNGVGIASFWEHSPSPERYPVHNGFLQAATELGIPGMLVFLAAFAWVFARLWIALRHAGPRERPGLIALQLGLVPVVVLVMGEPDAYSVMVWVYLALGEASAAAVLRETGLPLTGEKRSLYSYAAMVGRQWRWALPAALAIPLAACFISVRQDPVYEASGAFYLVRNPYPFGSFSGRSTGFTLPPTVVLPSSVGRTRQYSLMELLRSPSLLQLVHREVPEVPLSELDSVLAVDWSGNHQLVMRARHPDPEIAARVAAAVPVALERFIFERSDPRQNISLVESAGALETARTQLTRARDEMRRYLTELGTGNLGVDLADALVRRAEQRQQLDETRSLVRTVEGMLVELEERFWAQGPAFLSGSSAAQPSRSRAALQELRGLEAQLTALPAGSRATELTRRIRRAADRLDSELERLVSAAQRRTPRGEGPLEQQLRGRIVELYLERATLQARSAGQARVLGESEAQHQPLPSQRVRMEALQYDVGRFSYLTERVAISLAEARAQAIERHPQVTITRRPAPPLRPAYPVPEADTAIAGLLGLLAVALAAIALELRREKEAALHGR